MPLPLDIAVDSAEGFFILPVEKPEIPERLREAARKEGLAEKYEFHITILIARNLKRAKEALATHPHEVSMETIVTLVRSFNWEYTLMDEYVRQEMFYDKKKLVDNGYETLPEHHRKSIIQLVDLPDLERFYEQLRTLLAITIDTPVPHITLFAWSDYAPFMTTRRGIELSSKKDFEEYSRGKI